MGYDLSYGSELSSTSLTTDEVAAVQVELNFGTTRWLTRGDAKRHPKDTPNTEVGLTLAYARAFRRLADNLERHGEMLVRRNCDRQHDSFGEVLARINDEAEAKFLTGKDL